MLNISWIKKARFAFDWDTDWISFIKKLAVYQDFTLCSKQEDKKAVSALYLSSSFKNTTDLEPLDIVSMSLKKFYSICQAKNILAYIVK